MANASRDENREPTVIVVDENGNPAELTVDPVTGYLLVDIADNTEGNHTINSPKVDGNNEVTSLTVDENGEIIPLHIDNRNNRLLVDLEIEE